MNHKNSNKSDLSHELFQLYLTLRTEKKKEWNRILPFNELLIDRWEKAKFLKTKKGSSIYDNSYIFGDVKIGEKTWVGPFTILDASGATINIGNFCSISAGVQIYTHNSVNWALSGGKSKYQTGSVKIGSNCYLGPNSIISMGSVIGNSSIVGAQTLVNGKVPPKSVIFGTPGKIVGKVKIIKNKIKIDYFKQPKELK